MRSSVEDRVFIPPLPVSLNELKQRITTTVASVDEDMLRSVWTELDYRVDICRVTKGLHIGKKKGKAFPLEAWSGPEGSRKLRFQDFMTTAQDSGKVVSLTHRPHLPPGNAPGTHFC